MNLQKWAWSAVAVLAPAALSHGLSLMIGQGGTHIFIVLFLEVLGFMLLMRSVRPRWPIAVLVAVLYFPTVLMLIFQVGVRSGYYDFP